MPAIGKRLGCAQDVPRVWADDLRHWHRHSGCTSRARQFERHGERFAAKVLTDAEFKIWQARGALARTRPALPGYPLLGQEAFSKAIGLGHAYAHDLACVQIANEHTGKPVIVLHGELKAWFEAQGLVAHITVTDETDYAASFCVVECKH